VDCLKDPDISIRQRALELIYYMVNQENVETLTAELLNYLVLCPRDHRRDICTRILRVVERFSPDDRWRVDTLITMLTIAGREASREVQSAAVIYISRSGDDIHAYATHKLLKAVRDDDGSQRGLLVVGIWCVGEYGDLLLSPYSYTPPPSPGDMNGAPVSITFMALDALSVVQAVETVINRHSCPEYIKERALTCFAKLSDRYADKGDTAALSLLQSLIKKHEVSHSLELQLRACEYEALVNAAKGIKTVVAKPISSDEPDLFGVADLGSTSGEGVSQSVINAAKEALSRMPVVDLKVLEKRREDTFGDVPVLPSKPAAAPSSGGDLLDLNDMFGGGPAAPTPAQNGSAEAPKSDLDLLTDIFAASTPVAPVVGGGGYDPFGASVPVAAASAPANPLDIFGAPPTTSVPTPAALVLSFLASLMKV
jgi:AP-1 complex subunit gamma-1